MSAQSDRFATRESSEVSGVQKHTGKYKILMELGHGGMATVFLEIEDVNLASLAVARAAGFRLVARFGGFPVYTLNFEKPRG